MISLLILLTERVVVLLMGHATYGLLIWHVTDIAVHLVQRCSRSCAAAVSDT